MTGPRGVASDRPSVRSTDVLAGLVASLAWAAVTAVRLASPVSPALTAVAAFGSAAVSTVPIVVVARAMLPARPELGPLALTSLTSLAPVAVLAAFLKVKTHHRALGGVVFALAATALLAAAYLVARRVIAATARATPMHRLARLALWVVVVSSTAWTVAALFGSTSSDGIRAAAWDGTFGAVFTGAAVCAPRPGLPPVAVRVAPLIFFISIATSGIAIPRNPTLFATLYDKAPITLGILAAFGDP